jgi:hypothetical protein
MVTEGTRVPVHGQDFTVGLPDIATTFQFALGMHEERRNDFMSFLRKLRRG